jgi:proton-translocating NADH-quinone oxidoreductase chain M
MLLQLHIDIKKLTDKVIRTLVQKDLLNNPFLVSDYNKINNFFLKSLIFFHVSFLPFTVSFYMNKYEIFSYLNFHMIPGISVLYERTKMVFTFVQPHLWLLLFLFFVLVWSLVHERFLVMTLTNVTLYHLFYIKYYFTNTLFYKWPLVIWYHFHKTPKTIELPVQQVTYDFMMNTQKFFLFHPFTQLLILPFLLMIVMLILRKLDITREQFYLYLKYSLINFSVIYSLALLNLLHLKLKTFFVLNLKPYFIKYAILFEYKDPMFKYNYNSNIWNYNWVFYKGGLPLPEVLGDFSGTLNNLATSYYLTQIKFIMFNCWFKIDTVTITFMFLTFLLIVLCIVFLWPTMYTDKNFILYISQLVVLLVMLQLTFSATNLFTFFLAFESLLIPMIIMIALWGSKNNRQANNYLIFYTMVSALPMLLAILYLKIKCGTTNALFLPFFIYKLTVSEKIMIWVSLFFAFAVKTPMVPVHIWLPKTHVDAPTVGSVILAGVLLKVGLVGIIRFLWPLFPVLTQAFAPYVMAVATIGVLYASLITLRQIDIKRIIAYSSVAHMNMALVSFFSLNYVSFWGTLYLMVSHGLIASGLFFLVGFLYNRFHVRSIYYYSGLATCMPVCAIYFFLFTLANMAFPLTSGFIGEFLLLFSISLNNFYLAFLNSLSLLLTTVYCILLFGRMFLGELKPWLEQMVLNYIYTKTNIHNKKEMQLDLYPEEQIILGILLFFILFLGVYPQVFFQI